MTQSRNMLFQPFQTGLRPVEKVDQTDQRLKPREHDRNIKFLREKISLHLTAVRVIFFGLVLFRLKADATSYRSLSYYVTNLILVPPYTIFTEFRKLVLVTPPLVPGSAGPPLPKEAWR